MKVLHILGELNPSGAEVMLSSAGALLGSYDISGEILSTGPQPGCYADQLANAGYTIRHIPFAKSPLFFLAVYKLLKRHKYDAIHLHTERANFWFGLLALLSSKHCIRTIHNNFPFTGLLGWVRKWQRLLLHRLGVIHVAISPSVQSTEHQYYKLPTQLIPNWYNSLRYTHTTQQQRTIARQALNIPENCFVIVSIGNCSAVKNHTALIQAIANSGDNNLCYLHIGIEKDGSEQVLAKKLGVGHLIRFLGMQTDILQYLQAADLYAMPSTFEGFSIAALEAIATGLPAILSEVPGLIDLNAVFSGLFYCQPDAESIANQLAVIISTPKNRLLEICADNPSIAENKFGIHKGLTEYIKLYQN